MINAVTHRFNLFLVALISLGVLDGLWLGVLMGGFYKTQLSLIARMSGDKLAPLWGPALFVYVLLAFGIVGFVVPRNYGEVSIVRGALFGLVVYGVYDLTNLATLKSWPVALTLIDVVWGAFASAVTTWLVSIAHRVLR
jgi:uncharacterized membrane protein